jgi:hypothetical protein
MMADIFVPQDLLTIEGGSDFIPDSGDWQMRLEEVYEAELPSDDDGNPYQGYVTTDGEQINLQFGTLQPMNGQTGPPGNNKFFVRITLRDGEEDITTLDVTDKQTDYRNLRTSIRRLASLAPAMGQTFSTEFVEYLRQGEFKDKAVIADLQKGKKSSWVRGFKQAI